MDCAIEVSEQKPAFSPVDSTCFFRDGQRKIDFVIVWEEKIHAPMGSEEQDDSDEEAGDDGGDNVESALNKTSPTTAKGESKQSAKRHRWRDKFLQNLTKKLEMEEEVKPVANEKVIHFIKVHAPIDVLCYYAELLCFRVPLQAYNYSKAGTWSSKIIAKFCIPNFMAQKLPRHPIDYYTCHFKASKFQRFLGSDNPATFFSDTQRSRIVSEILKETLYGRRRLAQVGIDRLIDDGAISAAYPLHCGQYEVNDDNPSLETIEKLNDRQLLRFFWGRWGRWFKYQPVDHIRAYFGEQIGLYFAWLGYYTAWLLPASIVGVAVFVYGLFTMFSDPKSSQICAATGQNYTMCPLCNTCSYWKLADTCFYSRASYLFDHPGSVFFATFISFWAVFFLEYWKRTNAKLAHRWDCNEYQESDETMRPKYAALAPTTRKNPITDVIEPHFPTKMRVPRIISAVVAVSVMIALVVIFIIAVILYRVFISAPLFHVEVFRSQSQLIASTSAAVVNLILIMALSKVYDLLAYKLTEWEMHRTQSSFDDALITKCFLFQFFNFYSSIIYIGFFKGKFSGYPGHYSSFLGLRPEECRNGSCLIELAESLLIIFGGKQALGNFQEIFFPKIKTVWHRWRIGGVASVIKTEDRTAPRWEQDYQKIQYEGLFGEYMEMVIQFGFVTIFVAAFPLAPLFALVNNWAEIRLDAQKLVCETRRPVAERAQNIGIWFSILEIITRIAVISNGFLIAFTSDFLPQLLYKAEVDRSLAGYVDFSLAWAPPNTTSQPCRYLGYHDPEGNRSLFYWKLLVARLAFVIVFEHVVFGVQRLIDLAVPDVPETLQLKIKREQYLAREALTDTAELGKLMVEVAASKRPSAVPLREQETSFISINNDNQHVLRNNQQQNLVSWSTI